MSSAAHQMTSSDYSCCRASNAMFCAFSNELLLLADNFDTFERTCFLNGITQSLPVAAFDGTMVISMLAGDIHCWTCDDFTPLEDTSSMHSPQLPVNGCTLVDLARINYDTSFIGHGVIPVISPGN